MITDYFAGIEPVTFKGPGTDADLAYRYYDKDRIVLGKRMEDQLRFAVCFWHSFCWPGSDVFGGGTFDRPWHRGANDSAAAAAKRDCGLQLHGKARRSVLHVPRRRRDAPKAHDAASHRRLFAEAVEDLQRLQAQHGRKLLWGTANLFSHPRYAAGAATSPDPEVFAWAALQVRDALDATHRLGGANYVLWGGREGYETLLNTDLRRELEQFGRFLATGGRAQAPDRLPGHDPDRAQAAGADEAPVRLRRRRRVRLPAAATVWRRRSRSISRRTTPHWPATASSTRLRSPPRSASSVRSTPIAAIRRTAGTPTSFRIPSRR